MNDLAWDLLCKRLSEARGDTAEQMRVLAAIGEFVASVTGDLLRIAADGVEEDEERDEQD